VGLPLRQWFGNPCMFVPAAAAILLLVLPAVLATTSFEHYSQVALLPACCCQLTPQASASGQLQLAQVEVEPPVG
jgi:hypothetical protein